jgi:hypothetical protein
MRGWHSVPCSSGCGRNWYSPRWSPFCIHRRGACGGWAFFFLGQRPVRLDLVGVAAAALRKPAAARRSQPAGLQPDDAARQPRPGQPPGAKRVFGLVFWLELPVLFSWMYLCNSGNTVWLATMAAMVLIYYHVTDWRLATLGTITGGLLAFLGLHGLRARGSLAAAGAARRARGGLRLCLVDRPGAQPVVGQPAARAALTR